jgi:hypothetical protein
MGVYKYGYGEYAAIKVDADLPFKEYTSVMQQAAQTPTYHQGYSSYTQNYGMSHHQGYGMQQIPQVISLESYWRIYCLVANANATTSV